MHLVAYGTTGEGRDVEGLWDALFMVMMGDFNHCELVFNARKTRRGIEGAGFSVYEVFGQGDDHKKYGYFEERIYKEENDPHFFRIESTQEQRQRAYAFALEHKGTYVMSMALMFSSGYPVRPRLKRWLVSLFHGNDLTDDPRLAYCTKVVNDALEAGFGRELWKDGVGTTADLIAKGLVSKLFTLDPSLVL